MDLHGGSAALSGMMMSVALAAWMLGRWHGAVRLADHGDERDGAVPLARPDRAGLAELRGGVPAPCRQAALTERRTALELADSLMELHAEVSAYRRDQQVFAGLDEDELALRAVPGGAGQDCRYLGLTGHPICAMPAAARHACCEAGAAGSEPATPLRAVQPVASASGLTRV